MIPSETPREETVSEPSFELRAQPFVSLPRRLAVQGPARGDAAALIDDHSAVPWRDLPGLIAAAAADLRRRGVRKGDRVALICSLTSDAVLAMLGALTAGAAIVPLSSKMGVATALRMIKDCDAKLTLVQAGLPGFEKVSDVLPDYRVADVDGSAFTDDIESGDLFDIVYSSGTTGTPKGVTHSHAQRDALIGAGRGLGIAPASVYIISTSPASHTTLSTLFSALALGASVVLVDKFSEADFLSRCARYRVTHATLVPVQLRRLLDAPSFSSTDLTAFQVTMTTGSAFSVELKREFLERWPGRLIEIYGMTEGGPTCVLDARAHPDKLHTVGRPAPGCDIRIIGEDDREAPFGTVGEIVGRSVVNTDGYHNRKGETEAAIWSSGGGESFHRSGDLGLFDRDGFVELRGRKKDMIISGGMNVYPSDIEEIILSHPAVREAAVVGIPTDQWGESAYAFVTTEGGADLDHEGLRAWVNSRVGKAQRLVGLQVIDQLPRNEMGKILKRELRPSS